MSKPGAWNYEFSGMYTEPAWKDYCYYVGGFITIEDITHDIYRQYPNNDGILNPDFEETIGANERASITGTNGRVGWAGYMEPCLGAGGSYGRRDDVTQYADPNLPAPAGMIVFNDDVTEVSEELARVEAGEEVEDESTFSYAVDNLSQWRTQYKDWSDDSALGGAGGW